MTDTADTVKTKVSKEVIAWNPPVDWIRDAIENAGTTIGSVHFNKRTGKGDLRKMSYRLHVTNPTTAAAPKGLKRVCTVCGKTEDKCTTGPYQYAPSTKKSKKSIDASNDQITVLDANKVVRDKSGEVIGRGAWRTVPLEKVTRIANCGTTYIINRT